MTVNLAGTQPARPIAVYITGAAVQPAIYEVEARDRIIDLL